MTAQAGAALDQSPAWEALNWPAIEGEVRRLQARIVKAVQQSRWNKAKALQHLLTRSASGKFLAARRVTENDGRGTPGVDKELWGTPQRKLAGALSLAARGYHPQPLRRIYIPKAKRQTETAGDSDNAGQSHAGLISAGSRSNSGDHGGPRILRFPASAQLC